MFTDRHAVSEGNTKHFDGSYSAYQWSSVVRLSSAVSDDNFNRFSFPLYFLHDARRSLFHQYHPPIYTR